MSKNGIYKSTKEQRQKARERLSHRTHKGSDEEYNKVLLEEFKAWEPLRQRVSQHII